MESGINILDMAVRLAFVKFGNLMTGIYSNDTKCWFGRQIHWRVSLNGRRVRRALATNMFWPCGDKRNSFMRVSGGRETGVGYGWQRYYYCLEQLLDEALIVRKMRSCSIWQRNLR